MHSWIKCFDFVLDAYTLQVLPSELRSSAISSIASVIAPSGQLLVITRDEALRSLWIKYRILCPNLSLSNLKRLI